MSPVAALAADGTNTRCRLSLQAVPSLSPAGQRHGPTLELLLLALPMIGMTLSRMLMGFTDFVMVSWLGTEAQAAISPATMLLFAISCVGMGIAQAVQTFVSQSDGRGEPWRAGRYVWQVFYISAASALLTLPVVWWTPVWFEWFGSRAGHPPAVRAMEIDYLRVALWSVAPATLCVGLDSFYNGIRRPRIGLIATLAAVVFNVFANCALIFGMWGFPAMGIAGAGLATVLGWWLRAAILIVPLLSPALDARYHTIRDWLPSRARLREIVVVGSPIAFQWLVDIGAWVVFLHVMLPPFGATAMAGANIAFQYMHLSFMPALGIGMALTTQVGNAVGAGDAELAIRRVRTARRVVVGYMGLMAVLFVAGGRTLAGVFTVDEAVIAATVPMLIWTAIFQFSDGLCVTYSFAARGAGDTRVPALLFAICCWGIFVLGGLLLAWFVPALGIHAPWSMCALYIVVLGVLLMRRFHSRRWEQVRIFTTADGAGSPEAGDAPGAPAAADEAAPASATR